MSDLIKRSALKQDLRKCQIESLIEHTEKKNVFDIIDEQPTAYDVDKVVEELEKWSSEVQVVSEVDGKIHRVKVVNAERAINIAREGGVE